MRKVKGGGPGLSKMTIPLLGMEQGTVTHWSLVALEIFIALLRMGSPLSHQGHFSKSHKCISKCFFVVLETYRCDANSPGPLDVLVVPDTMS